MNIIASLPPDDLRCNCNRSRPLFIRLLVGASCKLLELRCFCFSVQQLADYVHTVVQEPVYLFYRELLTDPLCSLAAAGVDCGAAIRVLEKRKLTAPPTSLLFVQHKDRILPVSAATLEAVKSQVSAAFSLAAFSLVTPGAEVSLERFAETQHGDLVFAFTEPATAVRLADNSVTWVTMDTPQEIIQALALRRNSKLTYCGAVLNHHETLQSQFVPLWATLEAVDRYQQVLSIRRLRKPTLYLATRGGAVRVKDVLPGVLALDCSLPPDTKIYFANHRQRPPLYAVNTKKRWEEDLITSESEVWAVGPEYFQVRCILHARVYDFYVKESDPVSAVKSALAEQERTTRDCVELLELQDGDRTWAQCGVCEDTVVYALLSADVRLTIAGGNKPVTIIAAPSAKVHEVKQVIVTELGLTTNHFHLIYAHVLLQNEKTICDYDIPKVAEIRILAKECEFVRFETTEGTEFSAALLEVDFGRLKTAIKKQLGAGPENVWWTGEVRNDSAARDYTHLTLLCHCNSVSDTLYIHDTRGKTFRLKVHPDMQIAEVLRNVPKKGSRPGRRLVLDSVVAEEQRVLSDYDFGNSNTALLVSPEETLVRVLFPGQSIMVLVFGKEATLANVKTTLWKNIGIQKDSQSLFFGSTQVPDDTLLSTLGENVELSLSVDQRMVLMSTTSGLIGLPVKEGDSVSDLLTTLSASLSLPSADLRIFVQDTEVRAEQTLQELGLAQGGTVTLLTPSDHRLYIHPPLSRPFAVDVKKADKLQSVKLKIAAVLGLPVSKLRLVATVDVTGEQELKRVQRETNALRFCVAPKRKQKELG